MNHETEIQFDLKQIANTNSDNACFVSFCPCSEATQSVILFSRQGTTDTIEEVDDEQDQGEDKQQAPWESQQQEESQEAEGGPWIDVEPREREEEEEKEEDEEQEQQEEEEKEEEEEEEGLEGLEGLEGEDAEDEPMDQDSKEREEAPWDSFGPDEGPSLRVEDTECVPSAQEKDFITESEDGGGQQDFMQTEGRVGFLYTPDTDASKTSDADVPPSYSKAVSFDRLEVSDDESDMDNRKRRMIMTSDSRSDSRSDIMLPSFTTELTASDLLLNK